jgi:hypothetical protein
MFSLTPVWIRLVVRPYKSGAHFLVRERGLVRDPIQYEVLRATVSQGGRPHFYYWAVQEGQWPVVGGMVGRGSSISFESAERAILRAAGRGARWARRGE